MRRPEWMDADPTEAQLLFARGLAADFGLEWPEWLDELPRGALSEVITFLKRSRMNHAPPGRRCQATRSDGEPCKGIRSRGTRFCATHKKVDLDGLASHLLDLCESTGVSPPELAERCEAWGDAYEWFNGISAPSRMTWFVIASAFDMEEDVLEKELLRFYD